MPFILTSVYGTAGAIVIGVPIGLLTAVYLAKIAPPKGKAVMEAAVFNPLNRPQAYSFTGTAPADEIISFASDEVI